MTDKLTNKVALITGAASGIGRASAEGMAAEGRTDGRHTDGVRMGLDRP